MEKTKEGTKDGKKHAGRKAKAIIFDFDDTLINTKDVSVKRHIETARKLGIEFDEKELIKRWGQPWPQLLYDFLGARTDEFINAIRGIKGFKFSQIDGASQTLSYLKSKGFFIGILTSSEREWVLRKTQSASLNLDYFDDWLVFCNDNVKKYKPDKLAFETILSRLATKGVSRDNTHYCGDLLIDLETARNAGVNFIAVTTGFHKKEDFINAGLGENRIINSVKELPSKLEELNLVR